MIFHSVSVALWLLIGLCVAAAAYATLAALVHPGWSPSRKPARDTKDPATEAEGASISVLKPLCGAEPRLHENLETFCTQTHPSYRLLFGVATAADPAVNVVRNLQRAYPHVDIRLVIDPTSHGCNRKVGNLINLAQHAPDDVFVIADSDIAVEADYLMRVTAPLADPDVGVVTCLYRARRAGGFWARMGTLFIDTWFAPSVYLSNWLGVRRFGFGATLAVTRDALMRSGGFDALRDCLADDYWLAERVRALGLRTVLSDVLVATDVTERNLSALWQRETRWLRTIRSLNPVSFAFLWLTFTTPWLLTGALLSYGFDSSGANLAQSTADTIIDLSTSFGLSARLLLHWRTARSMRAFWRDLLLIPLRDALMCLQWCAACFGASVMWRDARIPVDDARTTRRAGELNAAAAGDASEPADEGQY